MKKYKKIVLALGVILVMIQFIPTARNTSNEVFEEDFLEIYNTPEALAQQIRTSCYDCHSNNTAYPWYNKIQPIAWLLENHIEEAKEELNFNEFGNYSERRKKSKLKSIISQIEDDEMPLFSYTIMHGDAKLNPSEKNELVNYFQEIKDNK